MKTLLFGGHHQTEQARKKRRNSQHSKQYGSYVSYGGTSASNTSGLYPVSRSKTFPSYFEDNATASTSTSQQNKQPSRLLTNLDSFSRSPGQSPTSAVSQSSPLKRKADEFELTQTKSSTETNPEHEELKTWATKPKKRLTLDPDKKAEAQAHNQRIQEAREQCKALGLKLED